jgi:hypothetical protein
VNANVRGWKERGTPKYLLGGTEESNITLKSSTLCTPLEPCAIPVMKRDHDHDIRFSEISLSLPGVTTYSVVVSSGLKLTVFVLGERILVPVRYH